MFTTLAVATAANVFNFNTSFFLGLALVVSEYLGTNSKLKSNSIIQLLILALRTAGAKKTID
jgi:uncharacterized membrane protein